MREFVSKLALTKSDCRKVRNLVRTLVEEFDTCEDESFLHVAQLLAHDLPLNLRSFLINFRLNENPPGAVIISGHPVNDLLIGRTPTSWSHQVRPSRSLFEEMFLILIGSVLGQPFGFATQQDGNLIHNVLPMRVHENDQLGCGSLKRLEWHTEDAFHPFKADYVALMCLRNPDRVPTHFASIDMVKIPAKYQERLFKPNFVIRPDDSHLSKNNSRVVNDTSRKKAFDQVRKLDRKLPILYGNPGAPYLQIDPYFMDPPEDPKDAKSLTFLIEALDKALIDLVLEAGDVLVLDNFKSIHGRPPFNPKYNGNDRWLKRINITRDIRRSRSMRASCASWILQ